MCEIFTISLSAHVIKRCSHHARITNGSWITFVLIRPTVRAFISKDIDTHLTALPVRVEAVVLLGTDDRYVEGVKSLMRQQFSAFQDINAVAFKADVRKWVFFAHPSPTNGTFKNWVKDDGDA